MSAPRLALERLEDRCVPVTWGNPWPAADHLTVSFVPDGTAGGGQSSNLFQTLDQQFPSGSWRQEILRALQTWAVHANINLGVVADGGQSLGIAGQPQGDSRFGDLRISAQPFTNEVYALSVPFDPLAGTWSGDVRINSNVAFTGCQDAVDLFTAMLQEAGHALGLGNSDDPTSVMFETYAGILTGLGAQDVARIQALYGARLPDGYEGGNGNNSFATASPLGATGTPDGVVSWRVPQADLTTPGDVDLYRLQNSTLLSGMLLRLERTGLSLVTPRVTVYDFAMHQVATTESIDPLSGDLTIRLNLVIPNATYYVKVEGASGTVFDVGSYQLRAQTLPWFSGINDFLPDPTLPATAPSNDDDHTDDSFLTAATLSPNSPQAAAAFDYGLTAKLRDPQDVDYYRVQAPDLATGGHALTVMAWGVQDGDLQPRVQVFDANQNPIAGRMLVNADGVLTFQVDVFVPGETYVVRVESNGVGDYFLGLDFNAPSIALDSWAQRSLSPTQAQQSGTLDIHRTGLFHFSLEGQGDANQEVQLAVRNAAGQIVAQLVAAGGSGASFTLTLAPGEYTFELLGRSNDGGTFAGIDYQLRATRLSDPVGPRPEDPTEEPSSPPPPPPGNPPESWFYAWSPPPP